MNLVNSSEYKIIDQGAGFTVAEYKDDGSSKRSFDYLCQNQRLYHFDGLGYVFDYLNQKLPNAVGYKSSSKVSDEKEWSVFSYGKAMDVFVNTPSKVREFDEKDDLLDGGDSSGKQVIYDVTGDMLDIGRYLDGEPEVFASLDNGVPRGKRVRMIMGVNHIWSMDKAYINERNKRIVRLIDWLESQGVRVQLSAITSHECAHVEIDVKSYHEPLDLNDVAVAGHSDFFRRQIFRLVEASKTNHGGYGDSSSFDMSMAKSKRYESDDLAEVSIYIGGQDGRDILEEFTLLEQALAKILAGELDKRTLGVLV